jgi:hypothetical protein
MFTQIFIALIAIFLIYIGIVESSVLNILLGCGMLLLSASIFYAAITGRSLEEKYVKWRDKRMKKGCEE